MKARTIWIILALLAVLASGGYALAAPSSGFQVIDGEVADDWGIYRTRSYGDDGFYQLSTNGFRPVIAFESLGEEEGIAYRLGEEVAAEYPDDASRAVTIFTFVRDRVTYTTDIDQFEYDEFAQNADELAGTIIDNGSARGDCEDSAVLVAVMARGAGLRSAIAIGEGHTAAMLYLPDYRQASHVFSIDGETGWIWCEATGGNNPLGWVDSDFVNVNLAAYEINAEAVSTGPAPAPAIAVAGEADDEGFSFPFPFTGLIILLWIIPLFRRRRTA
jgi:hypothetical protein